ncbi:alpha-L-fucosidase [Pontibacter sp. G13]|uniref:alpha-L-fucosidase n=1 Tax=Pontibacter sp. G13 TaxID=3074898 RepID=UPI00288BB9C9|nr:alpha-L-fucosidase [Pontibacter sp. G13]WNJ19065.1 alpha-L-fucosidase [Pontibacter sp. G13]
MNRIFLCMLLGLLMGCAQDADEPADQSEPYQPTWSSLARHETPQWLKDAKFGIYCHWGAQSVKLDRGKPDMLDRDAILQWKGDQFDAKEWVDLFQRSGAQFAGPVAWHVNGCLNWNSAITDWNTVDKGPRIDIYGELAKEIRKTDLKLIASFHSVTLWGNMSKHNRVYIAPDSNYERTGTYPLVYGPEGRFNQKYMAGWLERMKEGYELHQPDMVWVDVGFGGTLQLEKRKMLVEGKMMQGAIDFGVNGIPENIQQAYISSYYNAAEEWGKEVDFVYKSFDIPPGIGMRDIENGNLDGLQYDPWMADINMQQHIQWPAVWFYNPENKPKDAGILIDMLVDITSKNGRMLLNVPPKADGSFAENIQHELYKMGDWLQLNGEAIYGSTPWITYGEGPAYVKNPGHHGQGKKQGKEIPEYGPQDIRFTENNGYLYAILLDWPGEEALIHALGYKGKMYPGDIQRIDMLGVPEELEWEQGPNFLSVRLPEKRPCDFAYVLKIERAR